MTAKYSFVCLALLLLMSACTHKKPVVDPNLILKDATSFWTYKQKYVRLYEDYNALDDRLKLMTRESFLRNLSTGRYLPLRLQSEDTTTLYQLHKLPVGTDNYLKATIQQWAWAEYAHYQAEGKPLPDYHFIDMDGKVYSKQTTAGKILVLKCWFVHCVACVAEMPALNALKQRYKNRNDIVFVSLCLDSPDKVAAFLRKTKFDYATVPDQATYIENELKITSYPTHLIIDREGKIVKKVNTYQGVAYTLSEIFKPVNE